MNRPWKIVLSIVVAGVLSCMLIAIAASPFDDRAFEKSAWANAEPQTRGMMFSDLSKQLIGLSESEVLELIGKPDEILRKGSYSPKAGLSGDDVFSYYIGSWPWRRMDHAFICVTFDDDGVVNGVAIRST